MRKALTLVAICVGVMLALGPASAAAATITPTAGFFADDFTNNANCSLREAIEVANDDASGGPEDSCGIVSGLGTDTVQLAAGAYVLDVTSGAGQNSFGDLDALDGDGITIDGAGAGATTIDTADAPAWTDRVLHASATTTISDLTITDGNETGTTGGGGILADGGALALDRVRVTLSTANASGGGVKAATTSTSLTVNDSVLSQNTSSASSGLGGGLAADAPTNTIDDSVISDNTATGQPGRGGGVSTNGTLTLTDTVVADNHAVDTGVSSEPQGGGLRLNATTTVRRSTISGNDVAGGVTTTGGTARNGAGISIVSTSLTLVNSTVSGNDAIGAGGHGAGLSVDNVATDAFVVHSTFADNGIAATEAGSALRSGTGEIFVRGSIVETSGGRPACSEVGGGNVFSQDDNVFTDLSCGPEMFNDDADADPQLGVLADEGGPQVGAPSFLTALQTRSPAVTSTAIDHVPAADCDDAPSGTLTDDERSFPRPFDSDANATADCEAGATEVYPCLGQGANRIGTAGGETVTGTAGDDVIVGLGGNDTLVGDAGNDRLCGNDGNDTLRGGANDDQLDGGANTAPIAGGDFASFSDSAGGVTASIVGNSASGDGNDTLVAGTIENLLGSPQGDTLTGDANANLIGGAAGDDDLNGLGGDDGLDGQVGTADEVLFAGAPGAVTATLQDSPTQGSATGFGTDILFGLEEVSGSTFGDTLTGNSSANVLSGLAGDDVLAGGAGVGPDGNDNLNGGTNTAVGDTVTYSTRNDAIGVDLSTADPDTGGDLVGAETDMVSAAENVTGGTAGDTLTGDAAANVLTGLAGDDTLAGGNGVGPDGNDTLNGGTNTAAGDMVTYSTRNDAIGVDLSTADPDTGGDMVGAETDLVSAAENVTGGTAGDTLTGDSAVNVLTGLGGNDTLTGLGLADTLLLGAGTNTVSAVDTVSDTINCTGGGPNTGTVDTAPAETYVACDFDGDAVVDFFDTCPTQAGTLANGCPAPAVAPPPATTTPAPTTPAPVKKCKKGRKLKKGKCVKKKKRKK